MANLEAQRLLDYVILDYMSIKGLHEAREAFRREVFANQNSDAVNSSHQQAFLQMWWNKFYETYNSVYPDIPIIDVESFDKASFVLENVVTNNNVNANQLNASDHMTENISNAMTMTLPPEILELLEKDSIFETRERMNEMIDMNLEGPNMHVNANALPTSPLLLDEEWPSNVIVHTQEELFVRTTSSPQQDILPYGAVEYHANNLTHAFTSYGDFLHSRNQGESNRNDAQVFVGTNQRNSKSLLANQELAPAGRILERHGQKQPVVQSGEKKKAPLSSLALAREQMNEMNDMNLEGPNMHVTANALPTSPQLLDAGNNRSLQEEQFVRPYGAVEYHANNLKNAFTSYGEFLHSRNQGESNRNDAQVFVDTNQRNPGNLSANQQTIAPSGRILRRYGQQPIMQTGKKKKSPLNSLVLVEKEKDLVTGEALTQSDEQKDLISFKEIHKFHATSIKLLCCDFNTQGEFLATAGVNSKVMIWDLGNNNFSSREGHINDITDIRFRPNSTEFATSSLDKTVKIWDATKSTNTYRNLEGHQGHVMSVDYHPTMVGLLSSCDQENEIRLWNINRGDCILILKGGSRQVRFQPKLGDLLASSTKNIINIFDMQTHNIQKTLQGHVENVRSICWDRTGSYLASVSEDSARIWSIREGRCMFELFSCENKFQSCIFHHAHNLALVIGSNKLLELWNPICQRDIISSYGAHDGIISSLAVSSAKNIIASVSYDQWIKIWSLKYQ